MKTFKQFQDEGCKLRPLDKYSKINDWAAKAYAKQWIDRCAEEMSETYQTATIERLKLEIDAL